jgi:hypothetical protein
MAAFFLTKIEGHINYVVQIISIYMIILHICDLNSSIH